MSISAPVELGSAASLVGSSAATILAADAVPAGALLYVCSVTTAPAGVLVADAGGNAWTDAAKIVTTQSGSNSTATITVAKAKADIPAGAAITVSRDNGSANLVFARAAYVTGAEGVESATTAQGLTTPKGAMTALAPALAAASGSLAVATLAVNATTPVLTAGPGWSLTFNDSATYQTTTRNIIAENLVSSGGAVTPAVTITDANTNARVWALASIVISPAIEAEDPLTHYTPGDRIYPTPGVTNYDGGARV